MRHVAGFIDPSPPVIAEHGPGTEPASGGCFASPTAYSILDDGRVFGPATCSIAVYAAGALFDPVACSILDVGRVFGPATCSIVVYAAGAFFDPVACSILSKARAVEPSIRTMILVIAIILFMFSSFADVKVVISYFPTMLQVKSLSVLIDAPERRVTPFMYHT
jgi:hypothetical protein